MFFFGILDDTGQIGVNKSFQAIVVREPAAQKGPLKMPPVPSSSQYAKAYDDQVLGHRRQSLSGIGAFSHALFVRRSFNQALLQASLSPKNACVRASACCASAGTRALPLPRAKA